jgi:hypothetical protein
VGVGCAPVSPALAAGLPLAVAEQDHQLRGMSFASAKKTGRGAYWLLLNEPIPRLLAPLIAQLVARSGSMVLYALNTC